MISDRNILIILTCLAHKYLQFLSEHNILMSNNINRLDGIKAIVKTWFLLKKYLMSHKIFQKTINDLEFVFLQIILSIFN